MQPGEGGRVASDARLRLASPTVRESYGDDREECDEGDGNYKGERIAASGHGVVYGTSGGRVQRPPLRAF
jgi:hypothetical protein